MMKESSLLGREFPERKPGQNSPQTIGEAIKQYYEEQLTHAGLERKRKVELEQIMTLHSMSFN